MNTQALIKPDQFEKEKKEVLSKKTAYINGLKQEGKHNLAVNIAQVAVEFEGASGTLSIQSYLIYSIVKIDLTYTNSGKKVHFEGRLWGVGAGGVESFGGGPFVPPEYLIGDCKCHMQFGAIDGGVAQVTCWRDNFGPIGQFTGVAVGAGAAEFGGDGTWTWA